MRAPRVCFVITEDWYFWSHRRILAMDLLRRGCRVDVVTNLRGLKPQIAAAGVVGHTVGMQRRGRNPVSESQVVVRLGRLFKELQPDVVHLVGMKPILYGSIAARRSGVPAIVCAVAGLGWLFTPGGFLKRVARTMVQQYFAKALATSDRVGFIVQNSHHRKVLVDQRMASASQVALIPGSGVDMERFDYRPEPQSTLQILTHGRMLWDKGIGDLVEATELLRRRGERDFRVVLAGDPDPANPATISREQLLQWQDRGTVTWLGRRDDIPQLLSESHIACLPSHHEGLPLSLIEASAAGRPVVTTDIPGCRDVVEHGKTGLLVPKQKPAALADAFLRLMRNPTLRTAMGRRGRARVGQSMASDIINRQTFDFYCRINSGFGVDNPTIQPERKAA